jgi:geranylgeranyl pyrophosphate synthase
MYFVLNNLSIKNKNDFYDRMKSLSNREKEKLQEHYFEKTGAITKSRNEVEKFCNYAKKDLQIFEKNDLEILIEYIQNKNY